MLPEERDAERPVSAFERSPQTLRIVNIGGDDFGTKIGELFRLVRCGASRQRACGEITASIAQDRAGQGAALGASGTHNCDNLFFCHSEFSAAGRFRPFGIDRVLDDKQNMTAIQWSRPDSAHGGNGKLLSDPGPQEGLQLAKVAVEAHTLEGPETSK